MPDWFSEGDIIANNISIHYYRTGGDKPALALAHGLTDNGLCWTRVAQALQSDYDVIMFDARGHGLSDAPETGYGVEQRAADLAGFIQSLGLQTPRVIGHSMGADTLAFTAANYPDLIGCAILEDPPWHNNFGSAESRQDRAAEWQARLLARKATTLEERIAAGREEHPEWAEIEFGPWSEAKQQVSPDALQMISELRPIWREVVSKITCPTLLVTGDPERGGLVTSEIAAEAGALCPHLKVVHIAGAGHNIRREQFERYVEVVTAVTIM